MLRENELNSMEANVLWMGLYEALRGGIYSKEDAEFARDLMNRIAVTRDLAAKASAE